MITLKTLPEATAQAVFNQIATHMLTQGVRSARPIGIGDQYSCKYRFGDLKCAAGCLIGDDEYHEKMEGRSWDRLISDGSVSDAHQNLIVECQDIHDTTLPDRWSLELSRLAKTYGLEMPHVEVAQCNT